MGKFGFQVEDFVFTQFHKLAQIVTFNKYDQTDYVERRKQRQKEAQLEDTE